MQWCDRSAIPRTLGIAEGLLENRLDAHCSRSLWMSVATPPTPTLALTRRVQLSKTKTLYLNCHSGLAKCGVPTIQSRPPLSGRALAHRMNWSQCFAWSFFDTYIKRGKLEKVDNANKTNNIKWKTTRIESTRTNAMFQRDHFKWTSTIIDRHTQPLTILYFIQYAHLHSSKRVQGQNCVMSSSKVCWALGGKIFAQISGGNFCFDQRSELVNAYKVEQ